jgi:hypothetical protein
MGEQRATMNETTITAIPDQLPALAVQLQAVAAHPLAPAPLRQAVPLLLQVLQAQALAIAQLQAAASTSTTDTTDTAAG